MIKNLTGQRFGKLTVIGRAEKDKVYGGIKRTTWKCKCDCGNEVEVITSNLTGGISTSCGCGKTHLKDLTGKRFGKVTVLRRAEKDKMYGEKKAITWVCRCDCGNVFDAVGNNLKRGLSNSCGYCYNYENLIGQRFGKLTVIRKADEKKTYGGKEYVAWVCKCDCGNEVEVITSALKNGNTTSCGCKANYKSKKK